MNKGKKKAMEREQLDSLVRQYRSTTDTNIRNQIISQHLALVHTVVRKFAGLGESQEDLLQEGAMGLINAVDLYDPDRGVQFSTYATHLVEGQIRHYLRDRGKLIKQPAWVQELTAKIGKATETLTQETDRPPTIAELAERVGTTPETVQKILDARERSKVASLDAARGDEDDQNPGVDPEKLRPAATGEMVLPLEDRIFLRDAVSNLKTLERKVVHHFYYMDLNQTEIARKLGISVNYASYLLRGAIAKLKKTFEAQERASAAESPPAQGEEAEERAYSLSFRSAPADAETNLATERHLFDRIDQEVERARRYPQQFSILLLEPDAELPHDDLVKLARILQSNVRSIDLVARMRGDRFAILLPHTGREAGVLAERLVRTVANRMKPSDPSAGDELDPPSCPVTASLGFSVYPTDGRSRDAMVACAEQALLEAQRQGGNCHLRGQPSASDGGRAQAAPSTP